MRRFHRRARDRHRREVLHDPVSLALRMNGDIGGLVNYRRRVIAVGDELLDATPDYIEITRSALDKKGDAATWKSSPSPLSVPNCGGGPMRERPDNWKGDERVAWLCAFIEAFVGTDSLEHAPVLLSGMASVTRAPALVDARQAAFNLRQLSRAYSTPQSVKHAVALYNDYHYRNGTTGPYRIDSQTLRFERTDPLEDPAITRARERLSRPIDLERHGLTMADPREPMAVALGPHAAAVRIPIGPITAPLAARRVHDLGRRRWAACVSRSSTWRTSHARWTIAIGTRRNGAVATGSGGSRASRSWYAVRRGSVAPTRSSSPTSST